MTDDRTIAAIRQLTGAFRNFSMAASKCSEKLAKANADISDAMNHWASIRVLRAMAKR